MKKTLFILLLIGISCTSSVIIIKKSNNVEVKVDEKAEVKIDSTSLIKKNQDTTKNKINKNGHSDIRHKK